MTLKIALIRGRYDPYGGAERFVQNAVEALAEQGAKLTIITRNWPANSNSNSDSTVNPNIEPLVVDPFYVGSLWRDRSFVCPE